MNLSDIIDSEYPAPVIYESISYPSVENAFQASRFSSLSMRLRFSRMSPAEAKFYGPRFRTNIKNWEKLKYGVMAALFEERKKDKDFMAALFAVNPYIIECKLKKSSPEAGNQLFMRLLLDFKAK